MVTEVLGIATSEISLPTIGVVIGSAAVDLAYVSCGRFDAFFEYNLNSWDVAAGIVLIREAGGEVWDFSGGNESVLKREILATNGKISKEILGYVQKYFSN